MLMINLIDTKLILVNRIGFMFSMDLRRVILSIWAPHMWKGTVFNLQEPL